MTSTAAAPRTWWANVRLGLKHLFDRADAQAARADAAERRIAALEARIAELTATTTSQKESQK